MNKYDKAILERYKQIMIFYKTKFYEAEQDYYDMKKYLEDKEREDKEK